jgi:hypothetical protein
MSQDDAAALELLKKLLAPKLPITFYFYYDPSNGVIKHLKPFYEDEGLPYITVPEDQVDADICLDDYRILEKDGKFQLIKEDRSIEKISKIDDNIHQIPKYLSDPDKKVSQANYQFDLLIEQDNIKKEFRIRISGIIKDQYKQSLGSKQKFLFYVTEENDPNILYKTLDISLSKLLQYHYYTIPYEDYDGTSCNIYSMRYFCNYLHLVIE